MCPSALQCSSTQDYVCKGQGIFHWMIEDARLKWKCGQQQSLHIINPTVPSSLLDCLHYACA